MVARLALAATLVFAAAPIAAQESDAEDPYIWLEEIQGERALAKVDQWNADTEAVLTAQAEYPLAKAWARQILDDTRQIAMPDAIMGDQVTNLWRDADNPRGLWRTATLESYLAGAPEWRTLIDVDQLGEDEGQSWVWHGANCLAPEYTRCLVSLSPGGTDADVVREFDIATGAFVEGGFTLPEAKSNVAWYDENTLFVGTDEGAGSLTDSGYPRLVKLWERGTDFAQARLIAEGEQTDISMNGFSVLDGETRYRFVRRGPSFWTSEYALVTDNGDTVPLPLPEEAEFEAVLGGFVIGKLNSPMETSAGTEQPGALLAWSLDDVLDGGDPQPFAVFRPSETQAVEQ
ncbi:MAG TPA: S9 family peptidase, partial [Erythrobacter sp.]|nr:S9 family peptidase [Erythrobacter sp.]